MKIERQSPRHTDLVLMVCHCGDRWFENTSNTRLAICINGHSAHFPSLHRRWLADKRGSA